MRKKKILNIMLVMATILVFVSFSAEARTKYPTDNSLAKPAGALNIPTDAKFLTINSIKMPIENDAIFGQNPYTGRSGTEWPQGTGNMYIFGAGIWIGAQIPTGGGSLKKVVSYGYNPNDGYSEWGPGIIVSPDVADHGVEGPPPTYPVLLSTEDSVWTQQDSLNWPARDSLDNPRYVSAEDSWCFFNDADIDYHDDQASPGDQLNLLVNQTTYAFGSRLDKDIIFVVWDIYNQGDDPLDSVYIGITVDPDLGNATDDMIGFDSTRNMCWVWNYNLLADQDIKGVPGVMGFRFFESPEDTAGNQLGLTSFTLFTIDTDPANDEERYNVMAGRTTSGDPRPGGPFDEDTSPQDKRFCQSTGPFSLAIGDSARVVFGVVAGQNENLLKVNSDYSQALYDADFVAPIPPDPPVVTAVPGDRQVILYWGDISENSYEPFAANDTSLREYDFEGYRIYRSRTGIEGDFEVLAEFDLANGITNDTEEDIDPEYGTPIVVPVHLGDDSGIQRYFTDTDILNGETYYYAVVAYDYQPKRPKSLESGKRASMLEVIPGTNPAGYIAPSVQDTADHTSSGILSEGAVTVEVIDPSLITGHDYEVTFNLDLTWNLLDLDDGDTVLANQTNQSGDDTYSIVDGMMVRVIGPPAGIRDWDWTGGTRWLSGVDWGGSFFYNSLDIGYYFWGGTITDLSTEFVDVEIRFSNINTQNAYNYLRGGDPNYGYQGYFDCPFTIWDVTSDPERQLNAAFVEYTGSNSYDSTWTPDSTDVDLGGREYLFILNSTYSPTPDTFYTNRNLNTNGDDFDILYAMWPRIRPGHDLTEFEEGQIFHIIATKPNSPNDVFTFNTRNAHISATQAKFDMDRIKVVPNPYFVRNILDRDPNVSHLMLTHLPENCTIRLYTLAGNLIGKVEHTNGTGQEIWNVLTRNDQIPASGVYIYHVSSEFGDKVGRFAVIR